MKKEDFNNPYRHTSNRIGRVKGGEFVFNSPSTVTGGKVEEIVDEFEKFDELDDNEIEIEITFDIPKFIFWVSFFTLLDILFFK